ncbi:MAG: gluconate 2-dehydrogenase gamma chain [Sulfurimonas sp.]|jgi:gluconate 2-dehydrogenase gamma chain
MFLKTRRTFLQKTAISTTSLALAQTELLASASTLDTLALAQKDLYGDLSSAPSFTEINSRAYLSLILTHSRIDDDSKQYIKNGAGWLDEEAQKLYKKPYIELDEVKRQKTLESMATYNWGERWISTMLRYIYEAVLGDTIYGINKDESGWNWLNHVSGIPRPKEPLL